LTANRPIVSRSRVLAVVNQKGGVGKTTTAVNLAAAIAASEQTTLLVDLDPQANTTSAYDLSPAERHIYDALIGNCVMKDLVLPTELRCLQVVPAGRDLYGAEIELVATQNRECQLERAMADLRDDYDYILIDCPPSLGLLTLNALGAADAVIIPLQCEYYALEGLAGLIETIELVRGQINPGLGLEGIVLTMVDRRNNLSRQVSEEVRRHFGAAVFQTVIPRNVRLSEAPSHGKPILLYDAHSRGAISYLHLAKELLSRRTGPPASHVPPPLPTAAVSLGGDDE
jgi:chromosome partitioning protein